MNNVVSVIIVSFNTKKATLKCIDSVINEGELIKKEIVVVDNASNDNSTDAINDLKPKVKLIRNSENLGFAKAINQGVRIAQGEFILILNSDIEVKKDSIYKMVKCFQANLKNGAVVPRLKNIDGSVQGSVYRKPTVFRAIKQYWFGHKGLLDKYYPTGNTPVNVEMAVMASFLVSKNTVSKVGLLDERYFMYFEDHDYCDRIVKAGLNIVYCPSAEFIHYHGLSGENITDRENQWRRLIPSSKIYHGKIKHYLLFFIMWSGSKLREVFK